MPETEIVYVGQGGDMPLPQSVREQAGIAAGSPVSLEARDGMIIVRSPKLDAEIYTDVRQAEFLLSNAVDADDYAAACAEVRKLGLDPNQINHHHPTGA